MKRNIESRKLRFKLTCVFIALFSLICGILSHDYILGTLVLMCGMFDCYLSTEGRVSNYIFGIGYTLISAYLYFQNGQFGLSVVSILMFVPIQIHGILSWNKKLDRFHIVYTRKFDLKTALIVIFSCVGGSLLVGSLLSLIPGQNLAFLDSTSDILCICQIILMNLRYCENWYIYLLLNLTDLTIWSINFTRGGEGALLMLIAQIWYVLFNLYGFYNWYMLEKESNKGIKGLFKKISRRIALGAK